MADPQAEARARYAERLEPILIGMSKACIKEMPSDTLGFMHRHLQESIASKAQRGFALDGEQSPSLGRYLEETLAANGGPSGAPSAPSAGWTGAGSNVSKAAQGPSRDPISVHGLSASINHKDREENAQEDFCRGCLSLVILGASGDLAKKKTYPSILDLYAHGYLPKHVNVVGYARSAKSTEAFRASLKPWLMKGKISEAVVDAFLARNTYFQGAYGSQEDFAKLEHHLDGCERSSSPPVSGISNRLFYFAIPPNAFLESAKSIRSSAMSSTGFTRLIVEKPFGHDLASAQQLVNELNAVFSEDHLYRIDHYLAKEIVQNLIMFRFGNIWLEPTFNRRHISNVQITFKEDFGTEGRGGYFTNYGIIRDVIQNHLMQVLTLVAMEAPPTFRGPEAGTGIRDAKCNVLRCMRPIDPAEVVVGQYVAADGKPGYLEDDSIAAADRDKAEFVPTFAQVVLRIDNPRWHGVPFIVKAGKALDQRSAEIRIQFKDPPAASFLFGGEPVHRDELVMQLQPSELIYMKVDVKRPGLASAPMQTELDLTYASRFTDVYNPDAYTRLILDALRGQQGNFVRSDELLNSWRLFTPLLEALESEGKKPLPYAYGSRGPAAADEMKAKAGFVHSEEYQWEPART